MKKNIVKMLISMLLIVCVFSLLSGCGCEYKEPAADDDTESVQETETVDEDTEDIEAEVEVNADAELTEEEEAAVEDLEKEMQEELAKVDTAEAKEAVAKKYEEKVSAATSGKVTVKTGASTASKQTTSSTASKDSGSKTTTASSGSTASKSTASSGTSSKTSTTGSSASKGSGSKTTASSSGSTASSGTSSKTSTTGSTASKDSGNKKERTVTLKIGQLYQGTIYWIQKHGKLIWTGRSEVEQLKKLDEFVEQSGYRKYYTDAEIKTMSPAIKNSLQKDENGRYYLNIAKEGEAGIPYSTYGEGEFSWFAEDPVYKEALFDGYKTYTIPESEWIASGKDIGQWLWEHKGEDLDGRVEEWGLYSVTYN